MNLKRELLIATFVALGFSGCVNTTDPKITFEPPQYVEELPQKEEVMQYGNLGSLYGQGKDPLFADRKAVRVNDLITVVSSESTTSSSSAQKATSEDGSLGLGGLNLVNNHSADPTGNTQFLNKINAITNVGANINSSHSFTGSGSQSRSENFTTTVTARVIKVMENGNYFIEGGREILIDGEKQIIRVSGVVRPFDIDKDNTINSQYIADAKILYETQGDIKKSTEKNWGTKIVETIWPF